MAKIRVKCPACKTELEVDAEFAGQEVECGNCLEVFVANPPAPGSQRGSGAGTSKAGSSSRGRGRSEDDDEEDRPRRRTRSRRRDDEDDYEHDRRRRDDDEDDYSPPPSHRGGGGNGVGVASLILGITSLLPGCFCCLAGIPLGLAATITGAISLGNPEAKGMGIAGLILGICGMGVSAVKLAVAGF